MSKDEFSSRVTSAEVQRVRDEDHVMGLDVGVVERCRFPRGHVGISAG